MYTVHINRFYRIVFASLITIYLVILAGGIVRSTGSGMGCPDWPKCFGTYVPPVEESQLPTGYKEKYTVKGHPAVFNVYKTWTEYGNRLIGAVAGLIIVFQTVYAIRFLKTNAKYFWYSLLLAVLMGSQGVLGAKLVASYLAPILITLHMAVALLIMGILIWLLVEVGKEKTQLTTPVHPEERLGKQYRWAMWIFISLTVVQIFLGTEVREAIDVISSAMDYQHKETWISSIGSVFIIHRSYSILLTGATIYFTLILYKKRFMYPKAYTLATQIAAVIAVEITAGITLAYFALPPWVQPVHLLFATVLLGAQLAFVFRFMVGQNRRSV